MKKLELVIRNATGLHARPNAKSGPGIGFASASCNAGDVRSYNGNYGDTGWLGIASISVSRGKDRHITDGESKVNEYYITEPGYTGFDEGIEWQHVLCQELGHTWGLDHNRDGSTGGSPDDSCMNDAARPLRYPTANVHDTEQLTTMYAHDHGGGGGGGGKGKKPKNGRADVFVREGHDVTTVTFVLWA